MGRRLGRRGRLNRGGTRDMNYALHTIAVTHERGVGPGQAYLATAEARGKDRLAAPRHHRHGYHHQRTNGILHLLTLYKP